MNSQSHHNTNEGSLSHSNIIQANNFCMNLNIENSPQIIEAKTSD